MIEQNLAQGRAMSDPIKGMMVVQETYSSKISFAINLYGVGLLREHTTALSNLQVPTFLLC